MCSAIPLGRVVIAGGSGFIGTSLAAQLTGAGAEVTILSRRAQHMPAVWRHAFWDGRSLGGWQQELDGAAGLINLAGRSVDCIKTPDHQDEILRSRVEATRALGEAVRSVDSPPPVWVQMSTAHIYGDPPQAVCDEGSPTGYGLAPAVGQAWEEAFQASVLSSQRAVVLRTSFVLGRARGAGAGALTKLGWLARLGLGGRVGSGRQGVSWIHEADFNRLCERALTDSTMRGIYVASAPNPVSQHEFARELRRAVRMPFSLPTCEWMVRWGAPLLLRTDPELALYGRYVISKRLAEEGFAFCFPRLREALADVFRHDRTTRNAQPSAGTSRDVRAYA